MKYCEEMSERIMNASDGLLREITNEIEFAVFEGLTTPAKERIEEMQRILSEEIEEKEE